MTAFAEHECACDVCVGMCRKFPCRPTPLEVLRMPRDVQARLMLQHDGHCLSDVPHLQAGAKGHEGKLGAGFGPLFGEITRLHVCTFLTADGKCELHGRCKPFEGRVAFHEPVLDVLPELKRLWSSPLGQRVIRLWKQRVGISA